MTTDRDDASVRRYRDASTALDERPSAATRAAILAAAARQVDARPHAADAPRAVRRRWPLAAAAAVLLSSLAVMLAHRTEQEMPTFSVPAERAQEPAAVAPVQSVMQPKAEDRAAPSSQAPGAADDAASAAPAGPRDASPARAKKAAPAIAREQQGAVAEAPAERAATPAERATAPQSDASNAALAKQRALPAPDTTSAESRQAFPAAPTATAPVPAPAPPAIARAAPPPASAPAGTGTVSPQGPNEAATPRASMNSDRAARREAAPVLQGAARQDEAREFERSAQEWLERIVKLRHEGRDADADAELKRFRERYPEVQVPPTALPPGGAAPGTR